MRKIVGLFFLIVVYSCNSADNGNAKKNKDRRELIEEIETYQKKLVTESTKELDDENAQKTIALYKEFLNSFSGDELAPSMLLKAGEVCKGRGDFKQAIELLERVRKNYPTSLEAPHALFLAAFIYDVHLNQKGKSAETYEQLIQHYPDHDLIENAKQAIKLLTMSEDDLLKMVKGQ